MDLISRIEIKHLRSFDGGKDQEKVRIENLKDLNIFSGANDSGKSNVLRALNLFFNNEISPGVRYDKKRDFSKNAANRFDKDVEDRKGGLLKIKKTDGDIEKQKDVRRSDEATTIKIFFNNIKKQRGLRESFWISKVFSSKNNYQGEYAYQSDLNPGQTTQFIQNFKFEYIPAIKDRNYFNYLFEKLQNYLFEKNDKSNKNSFKDASSKFNNLLTSETRILFENFLNSSGVEASFHIPSTLVDFFRTLSVKTENDVSLFDRGDGVQARFIPEILDEISKGSNKNIIWGFEEPENSYEAKNIRKLKNEFQHKYSKKYQIFLTTHTKEFLAIEKDYTKQELLIKNDRKSNTPQKKQFAYNQLPVAHRSSDIGIYRVWKNEKTNFTSLVTKFDENSSTWNEICDDLGIIKEARIIEDLQLKVNEQLSEINNSTLTLKQQELVFNKLKLDYEQSIGKLEKVTNEIEEYLKPILVVEDKYDAIYKIAYLKCKGVEITKLDFEEKFKQHATFVIRRAEGAGALAGQLSMKNTDGYEEKKLIGLFDFDTEGTERFYLLNGKNNWDNIISGTILSGLVKKRNQHNCFYALLLPVPDRLKHLVSDIKLGKFISYVEVENLIEQKSLTDLKLVTIETVLNQEYFKIKDTYKPKLGNILIELPDHKFKDFKPLFDKIEELFAIEIL